MTDLRLVSLDQSVAPEVALYATAPLLERAVRHVLSQTTDKELTTAELMTKLWPVLPTEPRSKAARQRLGRALQSLATRALADCARRAGERAVRRYIGNGRWMMQKQNPWLWKLSGTPNPEARGHCPHCGGKL